MTKFYTALLASFVLSAQAEVDIDLNVSLGSEIGPSLSGEEVMPFWGQAEVGYDFGVVTPMAVYGHTSSADINGGVEYHGEYYGVGAKANIDQFYISGQVVQYAENNLERESTEVQMYELGLNSEVNGVPFRFVAFYENATSGYLERIGLKFGYSFDLK